MARHGPARLLGKRDPGSASRPATGCTLPPSRFAPDIPRELDILILSLLSLDPTLRPDSAAEVIERINVIAGLESEEALDVGRSYLSNPKLVGRERELGRLNQFLERVVSGRSASLVLEGDTGVGKTRLVEEIGIEAQLKGVTVVRVDAEASRGPYGAILGLSDRLFTTLPDVASDLGRQHATVSCELMPAVRNKLGGPKEPLPMDPGERRMRIQEGLSAWLLSVAERCPLVLLVDNARGACPGSGYHRPGGCECREQRRRARQYGGGADVIESQPPLTDGERLA